MEVVDNKLIVFFPVLCILVITFFINKKVHFVPEALAIMVLGNVN